MADLDSEVRRVLIGLSGAGDEWAFLDAAISLAEQLRAELTALFIEDADLLRASQLSCAREIGHRSAQSRQFEPARMERSLRQAATEAESRLRRSAESRALHFSFQVLRGQPVPQLLDLAGRMDAVLFAPTVWRRQQAPCRRPVALVYGDGEPAERALTTAVGLARVSNLPLHVLIEAGDEAGYFRCVDRLRERTSGLALTVERIARAEQLPERINRIGAGLLVMHADGDPDPVEMDRLCKRLCCDLLLLR